MPLNFLLDEFPNQVKIDEAVYDIKCDFKSILLIMQLFEDQLFNDEEKLINSLNIFYNEKIPKNISKAYENMIDFIKLYENHESSNNKVMDYVVDSGRIYAAFRQVYNIDLSNNNMHWFLFNCLLENISDGKPRLFEIIQLRAMELDDKMTTKQKALIRKLKKEYSLEKEEDVCNSFADSFLIGVKGVNKNGN
ncbi:MAG: Gp15 family bacteriophage protein [Bacilli bacterium]|uniref:Gp15 family bacteriophage protein n=1 Tax=Anaerorhabdus sp. TaxID=1872524 RepID=UPI002FC5EDA3